MKKVDINTLPHWSPWPQRLLGQSPWKVPKRGIEKVNEEYDQDKYAKCLKFYTDAGGDITPDAVRQFQMDQDLGETICVSIEDDLCLMTFGEARSKFYRLITETMRSKINTSSTVIELGCGFGYNLWQLSWHFKDKICLGGEYSNNAVRLATGLFKQIPMINVVPFNFYEKTYEILNDVQGPVTVFTAFAIEQIPSAESFFEALWHYRDKISSVFHFEPVYELFGEETLLGLMRRRYVEANDYNRDLLTQLQQRSDKIRILCTEANVLGVNPLNPISSIHWEFVV